MQRIYELHGTIVIEGEFREENFAKAMSYLSDSGDSGARGGLQRGRKGGTQGDLHLSARFHSCIRVQASRM